MEINDFYLNETIDFRPLVDWSGRHVDSYGSSETGETPQTRSVEEAQWSPRGKRSACNGNQQSGLKACLFFYP
jgi:hypothetical protein